MDAIYIILLVLILASSMGTTFLLYYKNTKKPEEIDIDEELNRATETISEYCLTRSDNESCRFNLSEDPLTCKCMLLMTTPENWNHAKDNKE